MELEKVELNIQPRFGIMLILEVQSEKSPVIDILLFLK